MDNITESIRNVHLGDVPEESEQLLFSPHPDSGVAESVLDNVPRYLFRVATPESDGITNETWVRSEAALRDRGASLEDIFFHLDTKKRTEVAKILNLHLQWQTKNDLLDNFVSWTSSLLFAIQYIYYRHHKDNTPLEDIKLFVVDTTMFPRGIFMRDLDLIDIFCESNTRLNDFRSLRNGGTYYFGEYFSQGSLKIEDKCQLIPAQVIFEQDRLRRIQPRFAPISSKASEWAKPVVRLRRNIYLRPSLVSLTSTEMRDRLQAIEEIMPHISASWRFPIAVYFAGLIGAETSLSDQEVGDDNLFFAYFHSGTFGFLPVQLEFRPSNFNIIAPNTTLELKHVQKLVREIHKHSLLKRALGRLGHAEFIIRTLHTESLSPENGHGFVAPDLNPMLARAGQEVLSKLGRVETMCNELAEVISIV